MPKQLLFQTLQHQIPVNAYVIPGQGVAHLVFHGEDHRPWHSYSLPTAEMTVFLRELLHQVETIQAGGNPLSEADA